MAAFQKYLVRRNVVIFAKWGFLSTDTVKKLVFLYTRSGTIACKTKEIKQKSASGFFIIFDENILGQWAVYRLNKILCGQILLITRFY